MAIQLILASALSIAYAVHARWASLKKRFTRIKK